ncbi:MFS transporter [Rhodocista pekingensis]|uniref:MFS transporter n=1 Tax=Rhodocista pekingensis TaxID=201185 RepID=A0ABW2L014_9PROT
MDSLTPPKTVATVPGSDEAAEMVRRAGRARWAVFLVFFVNGFVFANWVPRVAEVRTALGASEGEMGLALLGIAAGAVVAMPLAGWAAGRWGTRPLCLGATALLGLVLPLAGLATSLPTLAAALVLFGAVSGTLDVAMNVQGAEVERRLGRPVFAGFHGGFSLGGLAGAGTAALLAGSGADPATQFLLIGPAASLVGVLAAGRMLRRAAAGGHAGFHLTALRGLGGLSAIALICLLAEGAVADWSAILLADWRAAGPEAAGAAFALFSATMAAGRLTGDRLIARAGARAVLTGGGLLAAGGLALAVAVPSATATVLGFGIVGAGLSCIFPLTLLLAARAAGASAGLAIAAVSTVGYGAFLGGPPSLGFLAEAVTLPWALAAVAVLLALVPLLGARLPRHATT